MTTAHEALRRDLTVGNAIVVVGTGASVSISGEPKASWVGLLQAGVDFVEANRSVSRNWAETMRTALASSTEAAHFLAIAGAITAKLGGADSGDFGLWLRQDVGYLTPKHPELARAIAALNLPIVTTNYDDLLEKVLGRDHVTWKQGPQFQMMLSGKSNEIGHLHGYWREPSSIVLTDAQYQLVMADQELNLLRQAMASISSLLYVGFGDGLGDPHFLHLRSWLREAFPHQQLQHWRLCRETELEDLKREHVDDNITPVSFGDDFGDLVPFLDELSSASPSVAIGNAKSTGFEVLEEQVRQASVLGPHIRDIDEARITDLLIPPVLTTASPSTYMAGIRKGERPKPQRCDLDEDVKMTHILFSGEGHVGVTSALQWFAGQIATKRPDLVSVQVDYLQLGAGPTPLRKQILKQLRLIGRGVGEKQALPSVLLLLDNVHLNSDLKLSRIAAELTDPQIEVALLGCKSGAEGEILRKLEESDASFALRFVGPLAKADVRNLAGLVDLRRAEAFTSRAVEVVRAHRLPSTPFTFSMILSALLRGESLMAATSPTSLLDAYVDLLLGRGTSTDDSRYGLDAFNRSYILAVLAEHLVRNRVGGLVSSDAVELLSGTLDALDWTEEAVSLVKDLESRHVLSLKGGQLLFAQTSYLHLFAARRAVEDQGFLDYLRTDPLYFSPILAHYAALKRTDVDLLTGLGELLNAYEAEEAPLATVFRPAGQEDGHEATAEEMDAQLEHEIVATPDEAEDEFEPVTNSDDDLPAFPLIPVDQLPSLPRLVLTLGLVCNVLRDTEIVADAALRQRMLTRLLYGWGRFASDVERDDVFARDAEVVARQLAEQMGMREDKVKRFVGEIVDFLPLALAFGGVSGTLSSTKLARTLQRSLRDEAWFREPQLATLGMFMLYDIGAPGWSDSLMPLAEVHGELTGVRTIIRRLMFIAYLRQDLDAGDEQRVLEFLTEQTLDIGNVKGVERRDRRSRAMESLRRRRLQSRGEGKVVPGSLLSPTVE